MKFQFIFIGRLFSTVSTLSLIPSLSLHKTRFTCDVRHETLINDTNKLRTSFDVEITSPPSIPIIRGYPSTFRLMNGSRLTLSCQSRGGHPVGRLSWHRLDSGSETSNLIDNSFVVHHQQNSTENNITMMISPSDNNATLSCHVINAYLYSLGQKLQTNITLQVACKNFKLIFFFFFFFNLYFFFFFFFIGGGFWGEKRRGKGGGGKEK